MQPKDLNIVLVDTHNPDTIGIMDLSVYGNKKIVSPTMEITPPGFPKKVVVFATKEVNIYGSQDLGINCDHDSGLPDGVYQIKYSIKPNEKFVITKYFMKVSGILSNLYNLFLSQEVDCPCSKGYTEDISKVKLLIEGAVSAANLCDTKTAQNLYKTANKYLKMIDNECGCK